MNNYVVLAATFSLGILATLVWQTITGESEDKGDKSFGRSSRIETRANYTNGIGQFSPTRSTRRSQDSTGSARTLQVTQREIESLMVDTGLNGQLLSLELTEGEILRVREARDNALVELGKIESLNSAKLTDEKGEYIEVNISDVDVDVWHDGIERELKTNFDRNRSGLLAQMLMADISYVMGGKGTIELRVGRDPYEPTKNRMTIKGFSAQGELIGDTYLISPNVEERWGHVLDKPLR